LAGAGILMRGAEMFRFGPGLEILDAVPDRMGGKQGIAFLFVERTAQQMKLLEALHFRKAGLAIFPEVFEFLFHACLHLEAVHRDVHSLNSFPCKIFGEPDRTPQVPKAIPVLVSVLSCRRHAAGATPSPAHSVA